ncbi:MAG: ABC transporter permease, partial [Candidatus Kariarchaeaceae archaeon]
PVWFSIDYLRSLLKLPSVINEILFKVKDVKELDLILNNMIESLQDNGISSLGIKGTEEMDYNMMKEDVGTLNKFAVAIGMIILLVAIFIIYDSISKIIASQKTTIGILRALGASTPALLVHYISFGMVLTLLGILIGIPIGYLITLSSTSIFIEAIGFELTTNVFRLNSFTPPILLALSISFIASFIGTIKIASIKPVDAINDQTIKHFDKKYIVERFFDKISKNKYSTKIPVRQVFRRRKRSFMTALTIAIAALIILASFGFLDSFFHQMDSFYEENSLADMEMSLIDPIPLQDITRQFDDISGINYYEGMVRQPIYAYGKDSNQTSVIYAYQSNTKMRYYNFKEGNLKPGDIAIGQILARKLGIGVGDKIQLLTRGLTMFDTIEMSYTVSGITEEFFDNFVFIDLNTLQSDFGYESRINAVAIDVSENSDIVQSELYSTDLPIATVINLEQSKTSFESLMEAVIGFAYFVIVLGILVLILFSLNVIVLDIMDREREFVNIKINGGSNFVIAKIISIQVVIISLLVVVIDIFISPSFTKFIIDQTMRNMAYIEFFMTPISYGLSLISFVIGISIGLASAIYNVTSANIVETMHSRFKN